MNKLRFFILLCFILISITTVPAQTVLTGLDQIEEYHALFAGKRVGIVTNHTACNSAGKHITDIFLEMPNVYVTALFGPEHGIRGQADAGVKVASDYDPLSNVPIYSLYGKTRKPTSEMLKDVDILVFDIQDIGSRFYTYIWTMALAMESAAENDLTFVVLDRPNPLNGIDVKGNVLLPEFSTFVGMYPIPVRHGMTVGELAQMFNGEGWLKNGIKADLTVIPLKNWKREQWYDQTGLEFIKPSPNMPDLKTATIYPGLCLLEGTNVSEGRGTHKPFLQFGAPWIDSISLADSLNTLGLSGIYFKAQSFIPESIPGMATHPKYQGKRCNGVQIKIRKREALNAYFAGIRIVRTINKLYPDQFKWKRNHFDRLCGTAEVRESIQNNQNINFLLKRFAKQQKEFKFSRKPYLLY